MGGNAPVQAGISRDVVLQDPGFYKLAPDVQGEVLGQVDPGFASLDIDARVLVLGELNKQNPYSFQNKAMGQVKGFTAGAANEASLNIADLPEPKGLGSTLGRLAGGFAPVLAGAGVGAGLGTAIMPGLGTALGGFLGGVSGAGLAGAGRAVDRQMDAGTPFSKLNPVPVAVEGLGEAALQALPFGKAGSLFGQVAKNAAINAGGEAVLSPALQLAESGQVDPMRWLQDVAGAAGTGGAFPLAMRPFAGRVTGEAPRQALPQTNRVKAPDRLIPFRASVPEAPPLPPGAIQGQVSVGRVSPSQPQPTRQYRQEARRIRRLNERRTILEVAEQFEAMDEYQRATATTELIRMAKMQGSSELPHKLNMAIFHAQETLRELKRRAQEPKNIQRLEKERQKAQKQEAIERKRLRAEAKASGQSVQDARIQVAVKKLVGESPSREERNRRQRDLEVAFGADKVRAEIEAQKLSDKESQRIQAKAEAEAKQVQDARVQVAVKKLVPEPLGKEDRARRLRDLHQAFAGKDIVEGSGLHFDAVREHLSGMALKVARKLQKSKDDNVKARIYYRAELSGNTSDVPYKDISHGGFKTKIVDGELRVYSDAKNPDGHESDYLINTYDEKNPEMSGFTQLPVLLKERAIKKDFVPETKRPAPVTSRQLDADISQMASVVDRYRSKERVSVKEIKATKGPNKIEQQRAVVSKASQRARLEGAVRDWFSDETHLADKTDASAFFNSLGMKLQWTGEGWKAWLGGKYGTITIKNSGRTKRALSMGQVFKHMQALGKGDPISTFAAKIEKAGMADEIMGQIEADAPNSSHIRYAEAKAEKMMRDREQALEEGYEAAREKLNDIIQKTGETKDLDELESLLDSLDNKELSEFVSEEELLDVARKISTRIGAVLDDSTPVTGDFKDLKKDARKDRDSFIEKTDCD